MNAYPDTFAGFPEARLNHELAGALNREGNLVAFKQLLTGQRRPEVTVVCADQFNRQTLGHLIQPTV